MDMKPENLQAGLFNIAQPDATYTKQPMIHELPPNYKTQGGIPIRGAIRINDKVFDAYKDKSKYRETYKDILSFALGHSDTWPSTHIGDRHITNNPSLKSVESHIIANNLLDRLANNTVAYGTVGGMGSKYFPTEVGAFSVSSHPNKETPDTLWIDLLNTQKHGDPDADIISFQHETLHGTPLMKHKRNWKDRLGQDLFDDYEGHLDYNMPEKDRSILREALDNASIY